MLTDEQTILYIQAYRKDAFGPEANQLSADRIEAMERYKGELYGDEEEGYSKFVTKDLSEAVDWALAPLLRPLVQSGEIVEFRPRSKEDEDQAKIESQYVNYVIMEENKGFLLLHDCIKDALILKNCYAKHWWNEETVVNIKTFADVDEVEIKVINDYFKKQGSKTEIIEQEETEDSKYNIKLKISTEKKSVKIEATPPEELKVSNRCRGSIQESDYVEHNPIRTRSDLLKMGIPKKWLMKQHAKGKTQTQDAVSRDTVSDENEETAYNIEKASDIMDYAEIYIRIDHDEDGITELRRIIMVNDKIPPGDEWNEMVDVIPFTGGVPKRMPHRHIGESFQDDIQDVSEQLTSLTRQLFDNVYNTTHNQWAINDRVDEEDVLEPGAAAIFRVSGKEPIGDSIAAIRPTPIAGELLTVISHMEEKKRKRTGVTDGDIDPDILKQATKGAFIEDVRRKSQKIEMTLRMLAETFVKELGVRVHELLTQHQTESRTVKLGGGYKEVKPQYWLPRNEIITKVGLGTGDREEKIQNLTMIGGLQEKAEAKGLVSDEETYTLFTSFARELGEQNPEKFIITPDINNPKYKQVLERRKAAAQSQVNQLAEAEQVKGQFNLQAKQLEIQYKAQNAEQQRQFDAIIKQMEAQYKKALDDSKANSDHVHKMHELYADIQKHMASLSSKEDIETMKAEIDLIKAGMERDIGKPGIGAGIQE